MSGKTSVIKVFKDAGYLVNVRHLSDDDLEEAHKSFTHVFYDEKNCRKCDNLEDRHNETCDVCPSFMGKRQLSKIVERDGHKLLSMPFGATNKVRAFLRALDREFTVVARHPERTLLSRPIKLAFNEEFKDLRDFQKEARDTCLKEKKGIVEAPPRSGKTVLGASIICAVGCKAIIMASQRDWLDQFRETFLGSETLTAFTNAKPRQVNFCKDFEDFENTDVVLATPQQFMSAKGKAMLQRIKNMFTVLIWDEVHLSPALETSRVLAQINAEYRIGLSATPDRKQAGLIQIVFDLIGPVIYRAEVERWVPTVEVVDSNMKFEIKRGGDFTAFVNRIEYSKARNKLLAKIAYEQVEKGHMVLLPMLRTKAIDAVVRNINELAEDRIAANFDGRVKKEIRKNVIARARTYEIKVLVGNTKLLSTGLNIPRASCLIEAAPSSNVPNCEQRTSRILTPYQGKPQPLIIYVLDDCDIMRVMRKNEWWQCVFRKFNPKMTANTRANLLAWFAKNTARRYEPRQLDL